MVLKTVAADVECKRLARLPKPTERPKRFRNLLISMAVQ
jgi:hypothetical protein